MHAVCKFDASLFKMLLISIQRTIFQTQLCIGQDYNGLKCD